MKSIKILSGQLKNRCLYFSEKDHLRPTSHYMRQSVFNILLHRFLPHRIGEDDAFAGMKILDLFAGTGSYGIEALSRGAEHVTFVESDGHTAYQLESCLRDWGLVGRSRVVYRSFPYDMTNSDHQNPLFDIIFADPSYGYKVEQVKEIVQDTASLLSETGVLVLEHPLLVSTHALHSALSRTKGKKRVTFFTHENL